MNHAYRSRTLSRAAQRSKTRAKRESRREKLRGSATIALTNPINGDIGSLVQTPRERSIFSPNPLPSLFSRPVGSLSLLYFSFHCGLSLLLSLFLTRTRVLFTQPPLPPFLSFARARSLAREFSSGVKGRDPGATVSKYDTGIGYKETINHSRARANGIRTASE